MARRIAKDLHGGPRRARASRKQLKRYFIAAEGFAEQALARWLESLLTNKGAQIFFDVHRIGRGAGGPEPLAIKALKIRARSSRGPFSESFLFLDRDKYDESGPAAESRARTENLHLFWQRQNIEGLFIRLFEHHHDDLQAAEHTMGVLRNLWPGYDKLAVSRKDLSEKFSEADLMRARQHDEYLNTLLALLGFDD